jgi:type II secretory pathway component PulF
MPVYIYKARKDPQTIVEDRVEAARKRIVVDQLLSKGYHILSVTESEEDRRKADLRFLLKRISSRDLCTFTRQFHSLLRAGLPLNRILETLTRQTENPRFRSIIAEIHTAVKEGSSLSHALASYPKVFTPAYVSMIKSGEAAGNLDETMARLNELLSREREIRGRIAAALAYPIFLSSVGMLTVVILLTLVLPRFVILFQDIGRTLPLPTRILLALSAFFSSWGWLVALALIILYLVLRQLLRLSSVRNYLDAMSLRLPVVGALLRKREIGRFCRTLGTLLKNGIPILEGLKIVEEISINRMFKDHTARIHKEVQEGSALAAALESENLFPPLVSTMVAIGEESAELDKILIQIAEDYDTELDQSIKIGMSLLEPVIILLMGAIVGFIVISMLLPIFTLSSSIK